MVSVYSNEKCERDVIFYSTSILNQQARSAEEVDGQVQERFSSSRPSELGWKTTASATE